MNIVGKLKKWDRNVYLLTVSASRVGASLLIGMMLLIVSDVFLRFLFNKPVQGSFELIEVLMGATVSLSIAYCGYKRGHVAVEIVTEQLSRGMRKFFELIHNLVCAAFFLVVAVKSAQQAVVIKESETVTALLDIPIYPFIWVFVIGVLLLALVYFWQTIGLFIPKERSL